MAQFKYKARTLDGKGIKGIMNVADDTELQQKLHEQDAFLLNAKEMKNAKGVKQFKPKVLADFFKAAGYTDRFRRYACQSPEYYSQR